MSTGVRGVAAEAALPLVSEHAEQISALPRLAADIEQTIRIRGCKTGANQAETA